LSQFRDYFCPKCEWTDKLSQDKILIECPICGSPLTELLADDEEKQGRESELARYDPKELEKAQEDESGDNLS